MAEIWILDDDRSIRFVLAEALRDANFAVRDFDNARALLNVLSQGKPDVVISDVRMPGMDGLKFLEAIQQSDRTIPIIIMSAYTDMPTTAAAYKGGAFEFLSKPFDLDHAVNLVTRALGQSALPQSESKTPHATGAIITSKIENPNATNEANPTTASMIGDTPPMRELFRILGRVAPTDLPVLIQGETGTGKELVALALHQHSSRASAPFIALNTAAIPAELLEAELFGHEAGAFTGAQKRGIGRFEQAQDGTLFLDEIGDMPLSMQTRLLRVLAAGEFYRVGGRELIKTRARIVAATHQDLNIKVTRGEFRSDLLHRLDVVRIQVPPLRERRDDVPALAQQFLNSTMQGAAFELKRMDAAVLRVLRNFDWPGNVRQLENLCRRLAVMAPGRVVTLDDLPEEIKNPIAMSNAHDAQFIDWQMALRAQAQAALARGEAQVYAHAREQFERSMLEAALEITHGNRQLAAKQLGMGRNTITRKLGSSRQKSS